MQKKIILYFIFLLLNTSLSFGQTFSKINTIKLDVEHSNKIPYNKTQIELKTLITEEVKVSVKSTPLVKKERWKYSEIDTVFSLEKEKYIKLVDSISNLNHQKLINQVGGFSIDGYKCKLQFGGVSNYISYSIPSPSSSLQLREYYNFCSYIIELVGLNPIEIMEKPITEEQVKKRLEMQKK